MTIASTTSRVIYTADGVTTTFAVPFYFQLNADLVVMFEDSLGNQSTRTLGTDYNLTGATLPAGGTCTFTFAVSNTTKITIYRDPAATQTTSYNNNDPFPAKAHELALDKLTTLVQRLKDQMGRSIHLPDGDPTLTTQVAQIAARANMLLGFDASGNVNVQPAAPAGFQVTRTNAIYGVDFGVRPNGTDISSPLQNAVNAAMAAGGVDVILDPGLYVLNKTIFFNSWAAPGTLTTPGMRIRGSNKGATIIDTRVANGYAFAVNPEWKAAHLAMYSASELLGGGTLGSSGPIATLGAITAGSSYTNGTYTNVSLTGGAGTGAKATITVAGGVVTAVTLTASGTAYAVGNVLSAAAASIGGTGTGFAIPVATMSIYVQLTMNDGLGNELFVTIPKAFTVTSATSALTIPLDPINSGWSFNIYAGVTSTPGNYAIVNGGNASAIGGNQTVRITTFGMARVVPADKIACWQQASINNLSITNLARTANASGIMLFKAGYADITQVYCNGLTKDGLRIPNYTGDFDGSFKVTVEKSKFDTIGRWGINAAGTSLEFSNFQVKDCDFNLCGTQPTNFNVSVSVASIPNSATPTVGTSGNHNLLANDQIAFTVNGMTLAGPWYRVGPTVTPTTFTLVDLNGVAVNTTSLGTFTTGQVSLRWRPPVWDGVAADVAGGGGGIAWMGLIGSFIDTDFTQCANVDIYCTEAGSSDNLTIQRCDFENTYGKACYISTLLGGRILDCELLSTTAVGPTLGGIQLGTGFAAGGVTQLTIDAIKVRSDVSPATQFENFANTNLTPGTFVDRVVVKNVTWQSYDGAGQTRFNGFRFPNIIGTARLSIPVNNFVQIGDGLTAQGAIVPLKLKATGEWIEYHIPNNALSLSTGTVTPNTKYFFYLANVAANALFPVVPQINFTTGGFVTDAEGYQVFVNDPTQTYLGWAITDNSGNFTTLCGTYSVYPLSNPQIVASTIATPAGGAAAARLLFGTTNGFGIYYGSGVPTVSAAQGSIYIRSDGSSTSTRLYVNTNGTTGWTNFTSAT